MSSRTNGKTLTTIMVISPALAFMTAIRYFDLRAVRNILIALFGLFGFTMLMYGDAMTHLERFQDYNQSLSLEQLVRDISKLMIFEPVEREIPYTDPYLFLVSSFVGMLGLHGRFIFLITSAIYGYFFINCVYIVKSHLNGNWTRLLICVFIFFLTWKAFSGMISVRNWTASWILFYSLLQYHKTGLKKYLIWCAITPYVHFAYLVISPIVLLVYLGPKLRWVYLVLFLLSFIPLKSGTILLSSVPENALLREKADNYTIEENEMDLFIEKQNEIRQQQNFHKVHTRSTMRYGIWAWMLMMIFLIYRKPKISRSVKYLERFFLVGLMLLSLSNFTREISPVLSHRLIVNAGYYIMLVLLVLVFHNQNMMSKAMKLGLYSGMGLLLLNLYFELSITLKALDLKYFLPPPTYILLIDEPMSAKELIKELLKIP